MAARGRIVVQASEKKNGRILSGHSDRSLTLRTAPYLIM